VGVVSDVTTKIRGLVPDSTTRWSDNHIQRLIHLADCSISDECETTWGSADISLIDDGHYYPLPSDVIQVTSVEMSLDGTNFDDGFLRPTTYERLDGFNENWIDDRGTQPRHFLLLGTPGVPTVSSIMVYRPLSSVSGEAIRVNYLRSYPNNNAAFEAKTVPDWVEDQVYMPYVMSLLYAPSDVKMALKYWREYLDNIPDVRSKFRSKYGDSRAWGMRSSGPTMTEGDI